MDVLTVLAWAAFAIVTLALAVLPARERIDALIELDNLEHPAAFSRLMNPSRVIVTRSSSPIWRTCWVMTYRTACSSDTAFDYRQLRK